MCDVPKMDFGPNTPIYAKVNEMIFNYFKALLMPKILWKDIFHQPMFSAWSAEIKMYVPKELY